MEWASGPFCVFGVRNRAPAAVRTQTIAAEPRHVCRRKQKQLAALAHPCANSFACNWAVVCVMRNEELTELLAPVVADLGLECLGVEYSPSHGNGLVRVYIEAPDRAVTVDDCEAVSRQVSATLDVNDPVEGRYTLEVSSPGLDRPLYTPQHFARFIGGAAKIELNLPLNGRRRFQGPILAVEGDMIVVEQDGVRVDIANGNIHKARLVPELEEKPGKVHKGKKAKKTKSDDAKD
jgi:ribosome maturation factor RimP